MKVILITDVKKLGQRGEIKEVADGYAQNVLIPKKLVLPATVENLKVYTKKKALVDEKKHHEDEILAQAILAVKDKEVHFPLKANKSGGLFKAVTVHDVCTVIQETLHVEIPESSLSLDESIKKTGQYRLSLNGGGIKANATLIIEAEA